MNVRIKGQDKILEKNVYNKYGCIGGNISLPLEWTEGPKSTKSYVVTMYDPDAPNGWWHWVMYNIPSNIRELKENQVPQGSMTIRNSYGEMNYGGPCPPIGSNHRYIITVYALSVDSISINDEFELESLLKKYTLESATKILNYGR